MVNSSEITKTLEKLWEHYESDPSYTLIAGGTSSSSWIGKGSISLKQPLTNFDDFLVIYAEDAGVSISFQEHQVWLWNELIAIEKNKNKQNTSMGKCFALYRCDQQYWYLDAKSCTSSSLVISPTDTSENSLIYMIYGIKKKPKAKVLSPSINEVDDEVRSSLSALWERSDVRPRKTLLFGGTAQNSGTGTGTITLSQPLTNFDDFVIYWGWDNKIGNHYTLYNVEGWNKAKNIAKNYNNIPMHLIYCADLYWNVRPNTTTNSSLVTQGENCWIYAIWGINYDRK